MTPASHGRNHTFCRLCSKCRSLDFVLCLWADIKFLLGRLVLQIRNGWVMNLVITSISAPHKAFRCTSCRVDIRTTNTLIRWLSLFFLQDKHGLLVGEWDRAWNMHGNSCELFSVYWTTASIIAFLDVLRIFRRSGQTTPIVIALWWNH